MRRATLDDCEGVWRCLDTVARERKWLAFLEAPPLEGVRAFISLNAPFQFVAERQGKIVGWCDITPNQREGFRHAGALGMGLLAAFRGRGLGLKLLRKTLDSALEAGLTRIELEVLASNGKAISLYERVGFVHEGPKRAARLENGQLEDIICMALLHPSE